MATEDDAPNTCINTWTLAAATSPGQRQLSTPAMRIPPHCSAPEGQS